MAFGFLSSIIPEIDKNVTLYTSPTGVLTQGKVSISSKVPNPVRIRLAVRPTGSGYSDLKYLEYERYISYGETFETSELNIGSGQELVVRSDHDKVNFVFNGATLNETGANLGNNIFSGYLTSLLSTDNTTKFLYKIPENTTTEATIVICNMNSFPAKARIGVLQEDVIVSGFTSADYIEYDVVIPAHQTYTRSGVKLGFTESLVCSSSKESKLQFLVHGRLKSTFTSEGQSNIFPSIGIGTQPRIGLDVIGSQLISGGIQATGIVTAQSFDGALDATQLIGQLPALDGSQLIGVSAQGTGIAVKDNGSAVGTATTIDFQQGISAEFSAGIATIRLSNSFDVSNVLTVNSNKFTVEGATGNTTIAGQLNANADVQIGGEINVLNNNIVNVGEPTSADHAVPRSYVDSKTTAMSIALS